nr:DUF5105 domain-containing protein [Lysinibacillus timonensis]
MKKKFGATILFFALLITLAGCSSGSAVSKIEVTLDSASFVLLGDYGEATGGEEKNTLAVTLNVKNVSDIPVNVASYSDIKVYDGDKQLPVETPYATELGFNAGGNDEIGAGKSKDITFIFAAEKEKKYEISVTPFVITSDKPEKEVIVPIDTTEYAESYEKLDNPAKALVAYIETIYMGKENKDYNELVSADERERHEDAIKTFEDQINSAFYAITIPSTELKEQYANYQKELAKKGEISAKTLANANGKAVVQLEYTALPLNNLHESVSDYRQEYFDNTGDYDAEKRDKYALTKLGSIINSIEPKDGERALEIEMFEKDGKWELSSSYYTSDELDRIFAGRITY